MEVGEVGFGDFEWVGVDDGWNYIQVVEGLSDVGIDLVGFEDCCMVFGKGDVEILVQVVQIVYDGFVVLFCFKVFEFVVCVMEYWYLQVELFGLLDFLFGDFYDFFNKVQLIGKLFVQQFYYIFVDFLDDEFLFRRVVEQEVFLQSCGQGFFECVFSCWVVNFLFVVCLLFDLGCVIVR